MPGWTLNSRTPRGERRLRVERQPDRIAAHLEDAAHIRGGSANELFLPASEVDVAEALRAADTLLPIGAQSSLTGGATPLGGSLLSTACLTKIEARGTNTIRAGAGVTMSDLDAALAAAGRFYPPSPTFNGATVGGVTSTNAAGAATFKHGATRQWVESLTVVLATGDVLDIDRGATHAHPDGYFTLELQERTVQVPVPRYRMPEVPKLSAGYFSAPGMDLIDLFIGSEGTLGVITAATLRVLASRPALCLAFVTFKTSSVALTCAAALRTSAQKTWQGGDPHGIDISGIEHMDARCLELLREAGIPEREGVGVPLEARAALLITIELPPDTTASAAYDAIGRAGDADAPDSALTRFSALLLSSGACDPVEIAAPGDAHRAAQLLRVREAVPTLVNQRIGLAKGRVDARIEKTAADIIVPFEQLATFEAFYTNEFAHRGLDAAVWGHLSDGNLHPNVIPRSYRDVTEGREAVLAIGREATRIGGAPLAEHGVGRNRTKRRLLRDLYGDEGLADMRRVKEALDPDWKLAPGVIVGRT
jgi:D-lactate dehydrogenase (cytochrome)